MYNAIILFIFGCFSYSFNFNRIQIKQTNYDNAPSNTDKRSEIRIHLHFYINVVAFHRLSTPHNHIWIFVQWILKSPKRADNLFLIAESEREREKEINKNQYEILKRMNTFHDDGFVMQIQRDRHDRQAGKQTDRQTGDRAGLSIYGQAWASMTSSHSCGNRKLSWQVQCTQRAAAAAAAPWRRHGFMDTTLCVSVSLSESVVGRHEDWAHVNNTPRLRSVVDVVNNQTLNSHREGWRCRQSEIATSCISFVWLCFTSSLLRWAFHFRISHCLQRQLP